MSWYQSVAGAEVPLSDEVRKRIGVDGFGVDDIGVIAHATSFVSLLTIGRSINAISDREIAAFTEIDHGSADQVKAGTVLGVSTLKGLGAAVTKCVTKRLKGIPGCEGKKFSEYCQWAEDTGWELPVLYGDEGLAPPCLCLSENPGLSVIDCPVAAVPGKLGNVLCALAQLLCSESMKCTAFDALAFRLEMNGLSVVRLADNEVEDAKQLVGKDIVEWVKSRDPAGFDELSDYFGDDEQVECVAEQYRDVLVSDTMMSGRLKSIHGKGSNKPFRKLLGDIRKHAADLEESEYRKFALMACRCLSGEPVSELVERSGVNGQFERMPGEYAFVDMGENVAHSRSVYDDLNDASWNSEDFGELPLKGDADLIVQLLERITVSERLLIALSVLLENDNSLSITEPGRH